MTITPGIRIDWQFRKNWTLWFRFKEFLTVDPQARAIVAKRTAYYEQNEAEIFSAGISYEF